MAKPLLQVSDNLGNSFKKHNARYDDIIKTELSHCLSTSRLMLFWSKINAYKSPVNQDSTGKDAGRTHIH